MGAKRKAREVHPPSPPPARDTDQLLARKCSVLGCFGSGFAPEVRGAWPRFRDTSAAEGRRTCDGATIQRWRPCPSGVANLEPVRMIKSGWAGLLVFRSSSLRDRSNIFRLLFRLPLFCLLALRLITVFCSSSPSRCPPFPVPRLRPHSNLTPPFLTFRLIAVTPHVHQP